MESTQSKPEVLNAEVTAQVTIDEKGCLKIVLKIEAENKTNEPINLDEKYRLPLKNAYDVTARDSGGDITTFYVENHLEVDFRDGTILSPNEKYSWEISYGTEGYLQRTEEEKNIIIGPYLIKPQKSYKNIPIRDHKFTYTFIFEKPKPRRWWLLKKNYVYQVNDRKIHAIQKRKIKCTEYSFASFHLGPTDSIKIYFTRIY
ncbi:MAG TPA: hypothetical protein VKB86_11010, partial [Pyrinomonadaceae bacterium]|nr:hypothetical protein [Pyrinomonadaceae bacterium]